MIFYDIVFNEKSNKMIEERQLVTISVTTENGIHIDENNKSSTL